MALFEKKTYVRNTTIKTKDQIESEERIEVARAEANKSADRIQMEAQLKKDEQLDKKLRPWAHDDFFNSFDSAMSIVYPDTPEDISKTAERINTLTKEKLTLYMNEETHLHVGDVIKFVLYRWMLRIPSVIQAFTGEPKILVEARSAVDKSKEGMKKIRMIDSYFSLNYIQNEIASAESLIDEVRHKNKRAITTKVILTVSFWGLYLIYAAVMMKR